MRIVPPSDLSWVAGLLEGEGFFVKGPPSRPNRPYIGLESTDEDVVARAASLMGVGSYALRKRFPHERRRHIYAMRLSGRRAVAFMRLLAPFMGERRRRSIEAVCASFDPYPRSKLTPEQVRQIDAALRNGEAVQELGARFGVLRSMIRDVEHRRGKMYREVLEGEAPEYYGVEPSTGGELTLHWLAGYLEGEGSFGVERRRAGIYARISMESVDEDVVAGVAQILGACYQRKAPRTPAARPTFQCTITGERAAQLMRLLAPLLGLRRRRQVEAALSEHRIVWRSRLTPEQMREIDRRLKAGEKPYALGPEYGVPPQSIYALANRRDPSHRNALEGHSKTFYADSGGHLVILEAGGN